MSFFTFAISAQVSVQGNEFHPTTPLLFNDFRHYVAYYLAEDANQGATNCEKQSTQFKLCQEELLEMRGELREQRAASTGTSGGSLEKTYFKQYVNSLLQKFYHSVSTGNTGIVANFIPLFLCHSQNLYIIIF